MVLFINACVREGSRTLELAKAVLSKEKGDIEEVRLYPDGPDGLNEERLHMRETLLSEKAYDHPMFDLANQFAKADTIVVAAPYWDLMFPTKVRAYFEEITVSGITFKYDETGIPRGLCQAKRLIYVTTAGGPIFCNFGYDYVDALAKSFYGIPEVSLVKAEGLDIFGANPIEIIENVKKEILS